MAILAEHRGIINKSINQPYTSPPTDEMEILSLDFNNSAPLLNDVTVLCCDVATPTGNHDYQDDGECVVMVTD